jgi:hypothetical protein
VLVAASGAPLQTLRLDSSCAEIQRASLRRIGDWWAGTLRSIEFGGHWAVDDVVLRCASLSFVKAGCQCVCVCMC